MRLNRASTRADRGVGTTSTDGHVAVKSLARRLAEDDEGISLVEMLIAVIIVGVALTALSSVLISSLQAVARAEEVTTSTALGNELLEEFQSLDFRKVALYQSEAEAFYPGLTHPSGEALVLISDASPRDPDVPAPSRVIERNGTTFTVETAITWRDDPADGEAAADVDGPEDVKHIRATVRWQPLRGSQRSFVVQARRAPTPGDLVLEGTVVPDVVRLSDAPEGKNATAFAFEARTDRRFSAIKAVFETRGSTPESPILETIYLTTSDSGFTWSAPVLANTLRFNNGETLVSFVGTPVSGSVVTVTDRVLFLHDISIPSISFSDAVGGDGSVTADAVGTLCETAILDTTVHGVTASDAVDVTWSGGIPVEAPAVFVDPPTVSGGQFRATYPAGTVFQMSEASTVTATVTATRSADVPGAPGNTLSVNSAPFSLVVLPDGCPS